MSVRNLARSADGRTIHRTDCRHARVPWLWADTVEADDDVLWAKLKMGYQVCKVCRPDFRVESPVMSIDETERA